MIVLGLESTCDETACALVRDGKEILANVIFSQIDIHTRYGGVFPELACRKHIDALLPVLDTAFQQAGLTPEAVDLIAVSKGPGLIGALLIGLNAAKALALGWQIPYIGVNHVEAHLYAAMMAQPSPLFPALGLVVSGGHTFMVKIEGIGNYQMIGTTVDDAVGEAFDKVAALLGLPYPGGPAIESLAKQGDPSRYPFRPGQVKGKKWDFSFSGLKTNVLYTVKGANCTKHNPYLIAPDQFPHIAASFQETALQDLVSKTCSAAKEYGCRVIYVGGGVSQNERLKDLFSLQPSPVPVYFPPKALSIDNAAMIAGLGYHLFLERQEGDPLDLEPQTRIPLSPIDSTSA